MDSALLASETVRFKAEKTEEYTRYQEKRRGDIDKLANEVKRDQARRVKELSEAWDRAQRVKETTEREREREREREKKKAETKAEREREEERRRVEREREEERKRVERAEREKEDERRRKEREWERMEALKEKRAETPATPTGGGISSAKESMAALGKISTAKMKGFLSRMVPKMSIMGSKESAASKKNVFGVTLDPAVPLTVEELEGLRRRALDLNDFTRAQSYKVHLAALRAVEDQKRVAVAAEDFRAAAKLKKEEQELCDRTPLLREIRITGETQDSGEDIVPVDELRDLKGAALKAEAFALAKEYHRRIKVISDVIAQKDAAIASENYEEAARLHAQLAQLADRSSMREQLSPLLPRDESGMELLSIGGLEKLLEKAQRAQDFQAADAYKQRLEALRTCEGRKRAAMAAEDFDEAEAVKEIERGLTDAATIRVEPPGVPRPPGLWECADLDRFVANAMGFQDYLAADFYKRYREELAPVERTMRLASDEMRFADAIRAQQHTYTLSAKHAALWNEREARAASARTEAWAPLREKPDSVPVEAAEVEALRSGAVERGQLVFAAIYRQHHAAMLACEQRKAAAVAAEDYDMALRCKEDFNVLCDRARLLSGTAALPLPSSAPGSNASEAPAPNGAGEALAEASHAPPASVPAPLTAPEHAPEPAHRGEAPLGAVAQSEGAGRSGALDNVAASPPAPAVVPSHPEARETASAEMGAALLPPPPSEGAAGGAVAEEGVVDLDDAEPLEWQNNPAAGHGEQEAQAAAAKPDGTAEQGDTGGEDLVMLDDAGDGA